MKMTCFASLCAKAISRLSRNLTRNFTAAEVNGRRARHCRNSLENSVESLEARLVLTATVASTFRQFNYSVDGSMSGTTTQGTYHDAYSGTVDATGSMNFSSQTQGTGTLSASGSGAGHDNGGNYGFEYTSQVTGSVNNGSLSVIGGVGHDTFRYTNGSSGAGGGYFGQIPMAGTFDPQAFKASGTGSQIVNGATVHASYSANVTDAISAQTDLSATGKFTASGVQFDVGVTGQFMHSPSMSTPVTNAKLYWSTTNDLLGKISEVDVGKPLDIYWNSGSLELKADTFGQIPTNARYLVFDVDPDNKVHEASETNNIAALELPEAKLSLVFMSPVNPVHGQMASLGVEIKTTATTPLPPPDGSVTFGDVYNRQSKFIATIPVNASGFAGVGFVSDQVGLHGRLAAYNNNSFYVVRSAVEVDIHVSKANTVTTVAASPNPTFSGQDRTLTATVSVKAPGGIASLKPSGTVTFKDTVNGVTTVLGTVSLGSNLQAVLHTKLLAAGNHAIQAVYNPGSNPDYIGNSSNAIVATVKKAQTIATVVPVHPNVKIIVNHLVAFTLKISTKSPGSGLPTGDFNVLDGSAVIGKGRLVNGSLSLNLKFQKTGTHALTLKYLGDVNHLASTSTSLRVNVYGA